MLQVDYTYMKGGSKIHHVGADAEFVPPSKGPSLRLTVGETPGEDDILSAGKFFNNLARKAGIDRAQLTVLNIINCRPPDNVFPTEPGARRFISDKDGRAAVAQCYKQHVEPVLRSRPWERIDALGEYALEGLTGFRGIGRYRGSPLSLLGEVKPKVIATLHPSYIMAQGQGMIPVVISDLKKGTQLPPEIYNLQPTLDDLVNFRASTFTFDIETNGFTKQITMIGLCAKPYRVMVVPFRGQYIEEIKRIFAEARNVIGHNIVSFDLPVLEASGVKINEECQVWDTILMQHLIMPDADHDLGFVGSVFTQKPAWKHLAGEDKELYCARDVDVTHQCYMQILPILQQQRLVDLYKYTQVPLAKICHLMENTGIHTSGVRAQEIRTKLLVEIAALEHSLPKGLAPYAKVIRVRQTAPPGTLGKSGKPIKFIHVPGTELVVPWASPAKVGSYLYTTLNLPPQFNGKTKKVTTNKFAIERLINRAVKAGETETHKILTSIRKLRSLDELASSFVKGLKDKDGNEVPIRNGKIAPHFSPYGTSCLDPNTRVCTFDLRWIPLRDVKVGDTLIGFDEEGIHRKLRESVVEELSYIDLPSYSLRVGAVTLIASEDHGWLVEQKVHPKGVGRFQWRATKDLKAGDRLAAWHEPWVYDHSREAGYLSGFFDSEGNVTPWNGLFGTQKTNECLQEAKRCMDVLEIEYSDRDKDKHRLDLRSLYIKDSLGVLGSLRPPRLMAKAIHNWQGHYAYSKKGAINSVVKHNLPVGVRQVIAIRTSTKTFMAEGLLSHNSGRLSSSGPNMQNQPPAARYIYVPSDPEWCFVEADFSQGENRLTAWYANDHERLERLSTPGFSEHKLNAEIFFNVPYAEVVKDNSPDPPYGRAKKLTHGINYGEGPRKIAMTLDLLEKDVREWLLKWRLKNRPTVDWMEKVTKEAEHTGILTSVFGRKRWFWTQRLYGESLSFLPQSSLADICFRAMIGLMYERINWPVDLALKVSSVLAPLPYPARLLLQVHDSLVVEAPKALVGEVVKCLKAVMEQTWPHMGGFHLPAEVKVGEPGASCGEMH